MAFAPAPFSTRQRTTLLAIAALGLSACFAADRTPSEFPRSDAAGNSDPGEGGGPADTAQGDDTGEIVADVAGQDVAGDIPAAPDADNPAAPCEAVTAELQAAIDQLATCEAGDLCGAQSNPVCPAAGECHLFFTQQADTDLIRELLARFAALDCPAAGCMCGAPPAAACVEGTCQTRECNETCTLDCPCQTDTDGCVLQRCVGECDEPADCLGQNLEHPDCVGSWLCDGTCQWRCAPPDCPSLAARIAEEQQRLRGCFVGACDVEPNPVCGDIGSCYNAFPPGSNTTLLRALEQAYVDGGCRQAPACDCPPVTVAHACGDGICQPADDLCAPDAFEPNETRWAANRVRPGPQSGLTSCAGDEDWFAYDLDEGDDLSIQIDFDTAQANLDLDIHDNLGRRVVRANTTGRSEQGIWRAERTGWHTVRVYARTRRADTATYNLRAQVITPDDRCEDDLEPNDRRTQPESLPPGRYRETALCFEDEDWYALSLAGGDEFEVEIIFDGDESNIDMFLYEPGRTSAWMRSNSSFADRERISGTAEQSGEYLLQITGEEGPYELTFGQSLCEDDRYEPNEERTRARDLAAGTYDLIHCGTGEDWFAVDLNPGDDLRAQIDFSTFDGDLDLHVHEPGRSTPSERSEGSSGREMISLRAERSGEYTVRVFTDDDDITSMDYRLTLEVTGPEDRCPEDRAEPNDSRTRAETVREGTLRDLTLCRDEDWYGIDAAAGDELRWSINYDQIGAGNDNIRIELQSDRGQRLEEDRGFSGRADVAYDVVEDGTYYLRVFPDDDTAEFTYQLTTDIR